MQNSLFIHFENGFFDQIRKGCKEREYAELQKRIEFLENSRAGLKGENKKLRDKLWEHSKTTR